MRRRRGRPDGGGRGSRRALPPAAAAGTACAALVAALAFAVAAAPGGAQETGFVLPLPRLTPLSGEEEREERERTGPTLPTLGPATIPESRRSTQTLPSSAAALAVLAAGGGPRRPLRAGNFAVAPSAGLTATYDDNVNAEHDHRDDDVILGLTGALRARSLFERHSLGFRAEAGADHFVDDTDQSSVDWLVGTDGRLDLTRDSSLGAEAAFTRYTESAESPEVSPGADDNESPTINLTTGGVTYATAFKRFGWQVGGRVSRLDAEDGGPATDERDRTTYALSAEASYPVSRRLTAFVDPSYTFNDFDDDDIDPDDDGGAGDSQSVGGTVGARLVLGRGLAARAEIGYLRVLFDDPAQDDAGVVIGGLALEGAIPFGRQTTLSLGLDRSVDVTTVEESALRTTTALSAGLTEQLSPEAAVSASLTYAHRDFDDSGRTDQDVVAALGYSRALTQSVALNLDYRFSKRFSDVSDEEFYRNVVSVGLSAAF